MKSRLHTFVPIVLSVFTILLLSQCKVGTTQKTTSLFDSMSLQVDTSIAVHLADSIRADSLGFGGLGLSGTGRGGGGTGEGSVGLGNIGTLGKRGGTGSGSGYGRGAGAGSARNRPSGIDAGISDRGSLMAAKGNSDKLEKSEDILLENNFVSLSDWNEFSFYPSTSRTSWNRFMRMATRDTMPPPGSIQIHELLNGPVYFHDTLDQRLFIHSELAKASWETTDYAWFLTVRAPADTILDKPVWNITFNEGLVESYRLLGQEDYMENVSDSTTLQLAGGLSSHAMFQLKLLRKPEPGETFAEVVFTFESAEERHEVSHMAVIKNLQNPSSDFQFALALTEVGLWLRQSQFRGTANPDSAFARLIKIPQKTSYVNRALRCLVRFRTPPK